MSAAMGKDKIEAGNQSENLTKRGQGRPKGSLNKTTASAKAIIEEAAQGLGGAERLLEWAKEDAANEKAFWSVVFPKLLPLQVNADVATTVVRKTVYEAPPE